jgi:hypothetical protein
MSQQDARQSFILSCSQKLSLAVISQPNSRSSQMTDEDVGKMNFYSVPVQFNVRGNLYFTD